MTPTGASCNQNWSAGVVRKDRSMPVCPASVAAIASADSFYFLHEKGYPDNEAYADT
jgi:hypothetical protein